MEPWTKRTYIRAGLAALLSLLSGLAAVAIDGIITLAEGLTVASTSVGVAAAWLGIGSQSNAVEPFYHNEEHVEVPRPPAQPVANPDTA